MDNEKKKNFLEGKIVSNKMQKTVTVVVERSFRHPKYNKLIKRETKYYAHCELGGAEIGKRVKMIECRPLSKLKRWQVIEIIEEGVVGA